MLVIKLLSIRLNILASDIISFIYSMCYKINRFWNANSHTYDFERDEEWVYNESSFQFTNQYWPIEKGNQHDKSNEGEKKLKSKPRNRIRIVSFYYTIYVTERFFYNKQHLSLVWPNDELNLVSIFELPSRENTEKKSIQSNWWLNDFINHTN